MDNQLHKDALKLTKQKQYDAADKLYLIILETEPENATALHFHGLIQAMKGNYSEGIPAMEKALSLEPYSSYFHHNIAEIFGRLGEKEKAIHHFQQVLRLNPGFAKAYQGLSECRSFKGDNEFPISIISRLENPKTTDSDRTYLHFALGKVYADSKRYEEAFEHYRLGNKLKNVDFCTKKHHLFMNRIINSFTLGLARKTREWGLYDHKPIFVLGMPRSGTSLVEQILSSHSHVFGVGELADLFNIAKAIQSKSSSGSPYPVCIDEIKHADILGFGLEYLSNLRTKSDAPRVVNKALINHQFIGLILMIFPNATIIYTKRDPIDTCLSCFFKNFTNGMEFSFNLVTLAEYYNGYQKLLTHWKKLYPGRIHEVEYEQMTANPESTIREILDYCSLPWDSQCLNFHDTNRSVSTASKYQVRMPIYKSSVARWKNYEKQLQPLISRIRPQGRL